MGRKVKVKSYTREGYKVEGPVKVSAHTREIESKPASSGTKPPKMSMEKRGKYYVEINPGEKEYFDKIPKDVYWAEGYQDPKDKGKGYLLKLTNRGTASIPVIQVSTGKQIRKGSSSKLDKNKKTYVKDINSNTKAPSQVIGIQSFNRDELKYYTNKYYDIFIEKDNKPDWLPESKWRQTYTIRRKTLKPSQLISVRTFDKYMRLISYPDEFKDITFTSEEKKNLRKLIEQRASSEFALMDDIIRGSKTKNRDFSKHPMRTKFKNKLGY